MICMFNILGCVRDSHFTLPPADDLTHTRCYVARGRGWHQVLPHSKLFKTSGISGLLFWEVMFKGACTKQPWGHTVSKICNVCFSFS